MSSIYVKSFSANAQKTLFGVRDSAQNLLECGAFDVHETHINSPFQRNLIFRGLLARETAGIKKSARRRLAFFVFWEGEVSPSRLFASQIRRYPLGAITRSCC